MLPRFPDFERPPIVELVLGIQFAPLVRLTSGHLGWFWKQYLGTDWTHASDAPPLADQFESFGPQKQWRIPGVQVSLAPTVTPPRLQIGNVAGDRLIQLQASRFHYNWKRRATSYPRFRTLLLEFDGLFDKFRTFVAEGEQDRLVPNQWELTYVDAIPQGELWHSPEEWCNVLPGLFARTATIEGLRLENGTLEWSFEIAPQRGRLHIVVRQAHSTETNGTVLLLQMTARGPIGKDDSQDLKSGLDLGHQAAVSAFFALTSQTAKEHWGLKK